MAMKKMAKEEDANELERLISKLGQENESNDMLKKLQ